MRCSEVQQKLDLFTTQELAPSVRARILTHLESCAECREALARLRRLGNLLAASPAPPVPEGFASRVVARAKEQQPVAATRRPAPTRSSRLAWNRLRFAAGTAAALAVGLVLGMFMGHETWRPVGQQALDATTRPADLLAASGFDYLVEPGGDSLAQAYVGLTTATDR